MFKIEELIKAKKRELIENSRRVHGRAYGYCIYLDNQLYSRFRDCEARFNHMKTRKFKVASYQADVKLIYHKDPPDVLVVSKPTNYLSYYK